MPGFSQSALGLLERAQFPLVILTCGNRQFVVAKDGIRCGVRVVLHLTRATRKGREVENRFVETLKSAARQIIGVFMIFFGSLLALNVSVGPCGGTVLAVEPFPAIFVSIFGFALIVCSYFPVQTLKVESDFRVVI
jgi:hypothetical protein